MSLLLAATALDARTVYRCVRDGTVSLASAREKAAHCRSLLADGVDPIELQVAAAEHEVSFALGSDFHVHGDEGPYIRLAFGFAKVPDITEGMARLARSIESLRPS